ncbi:MAG TPA: hypothetical protein VEK57_22905 [Thermoanaerobaculia bacterium]|nr:hypothetical protein [Thermoanaerobaculia bacterium]
MPRPRSPEDVTATIYSALGIDYTKVRTDDPLGRGFEYVPYAKDGATGPLKSSGRRNSSLEIPPEDARDLAAF